MKAIVLGAGPAGLAAAQALVEGGAVVTVLEENAQPGGLAQSQRIGTHLADLGPHRLHLESGPTVRALLSGAGGLRPRARKGLLHLDPSRGRPGSAARSAAGGAVPYPLSLSSTLAALGVARSLAFGLGAMFMRGRGGDSYAAEGKRRIGAPLFRALYEPAAQKIWGLSADTLDKDQARARVGADSWRALFSRFFGRGEPGTFLYPAHGTNGSAYNAWASDLRARGVTFVFGARADSVLHEKGTVRGARATLGDRSEIFPGVRVVSTLALPRLVERLCPSIQAPYLDLHLRTLVILHIVIARSRLTDRDVHYFSSDTVPFARLTEQAAFGCDESAPDNETVLGLDFYDEAGGPTTRSSPEDLLEIAWPTLRCFGLERAEIRALSSVVRDNAYPVFHRGYRREREAALDALVSIEGLISTGRGGLFLHVNQHHAIEMGLLAGQTALLDAPSSTWRDRARRFEDVHVVD